MNYCRFLLKYKWNIGEPLFFVSPSEATPTSVCKILIIYRKLSVLKLRCLLAYSVLLIAVAMSSCADEKYPSMPCETDVTMMYSSLIVIYCFFC